MAAKIKLTVQSNFDQATQDIRKFGQLTEQEAKRIAKSLKRVQNFNADAFVEQNRRIAASVTATQGRMEGLQVANRNLQRKMEMLIRNGMDPQSEALKRLQREYVANAEAIQRMEQQQEAANKAMERGIQLAQALGIALVAATAYGTKAQAEYAKEIANVNTLIDISQKEFESLDSTLESLSLTFATQKKELSAGVYQAVSSGAIDLSEAIDTVTNSAVLGKAALIDNATSVDIITTAMNAYGKEVVSAEKASDIYFQTIKKGKINGEQLAATIGQSVTLFASVKIPLEELAAGVATLTKVGVKASEATTQLNGVVNSFIKPSEAMTAALKANHIESGAALLEAEGLAGAMAFLQKETGGSTVELGKLMPNIRGMKGALALMSKEGEVLNDVMADFASDRVTGAAAKAMEKQTKGFAKSVYSTEQALIAIQNLAMMIGEVALPILGKLAEFLTILATDFQSLNAPTKFLLRTIPMVTAAMGAFLVSMNIGSIVAAATASLSTLGVAISSLGAIIAANPVGAFAISLAAISTAVTIGVTENMEAAADASGKWAAASSKDFKKMMKVLEDYEALKIKPRKDITKDEKKQLKALEKQIEKTTAGTLRWNKATNKASIDLGHGITQNAAFYKKVSEARDANAEKRKASIAAQIKAATELAEKEKELAEKARKTEQERRVAEAAAAEARNRLMTEAGDLKEELQLADLVRGKKGLEKENFMIELAYKQRRNLLIKAFGEDTEMLKSLQAQRDEQLAEAAGQFEKKDKTNELKARLYNEEALRLEANNKTLSEMETFAALVAEQENLNTEAKILRLQEEMLRIKELENLNADEKLAGEKALSDAILKIEEDSAKKSAEIMSKKTGAMRLMASTTHSLFGALDTIMQNSGKKSRAFAMLQKATAIAMIGIDTARAFVKTLADGGPYPVNTINAGLILATGLAQGAAVATTPIPSAETGGRFQVPEAGIHRSDGTMMKVNPGEEVNVTARGEEGQTITTKVIINDSVLWESTQRGIDSGEITFTDDNLV